MEQIGERGKTLCEICKCAWFKPGFYMIRHLTVCERKLNLNRVAEEFTDLFEETAVLDGNSISSNTLDTEIEGDLANNNFFDEDYSSVPSTRTTCASTTGIPYYGKHADIIPHKLRTTLGDDNLYENGYKDEAELSMEGYFGTGVLKCITGEQFGRHVKAHSLTVEGLNKSVHPHISKSELELKNFADKFSLSTAAGQELMELFAKHSDQQLKRNIRDNVNKNIRRNMNAKLVELPYPEHWAMNTMLHPLPLQKFSYKDPLEAIQSLLINPTVMLKWKAHIQMVPFADYQQDAPHDRYKILFYLKYFNIYIYILYKTLQTMSQFVLFLNTD